MVIDQFSILAHPEPTQAAAPSPVAGNQGTLRKAGHAEAYLGVNPCTRSCKSPRGGNCSGRTSSTFMSSVSQACARVCNMPVPEAIERLQTERPRKWRYKYSPKDSHWATREKVSGACVASQRSFGGQYLACNTAPVRTWITASSNLLC